MLKAPGDVAAVMATPRQEYAMRGPPAQHLAAHRQFKKHKTLPRPPTANTENPTGDPPDWDLFVENSSSATTGSASSPASSPRTLKQRARRIGSGPDLPPTPPRHSQFSSGGHLGQPPGHSPPESAEGIPQVPPILQLPVTPPDQRNPPTPDVTPPQPANRPFALQPSAMERGHTGARTATSGSYTESFKTAREDPFSSEDEGAAYTARSRFTSGSTSQTTILRAPTGTTPRVIQAESLNTALGHLAQSQENDASTPITYGPVSLPNGEWAVADAVHKEWDDNLQRYVSVSRHRPVEASKPPRIKKPYIVEDNIIPPTKAAEEVRNMSLGDQPRKASSAKSSPMKSRQQAAAEPSKSAITSGSRKSSGTSNLSTPSTVISAFLVETPSPPQRTRTLRHVKKRQTLRDVSPADKPRAVTAPTTVATRAAVTSPAVVIKQTTSLSRPLVRPPISRDNDVGRRRDSAISTSSSNAAGSLSIKEIRKSGGVPVIVVPERRSSTKNSREPSLRSTSSRRSRRTRSVGSTPQDRSPLTEQEPKFARLGRHETRVAGAARGEERTMDYAPVVPPRSSSLSAPTSRNTSRNVSRTGSLTVESIKALNTFNRETEKKNQAAPTTPALLASPQLPVSPRSDAFRRPSIDPTDETISVRKFSSRTTPFSMVSGDTNWTALEVSEALAVHMYPHQNSSVLMVNHSSKPSDASDATSRPGKESQDGMKRYELHDPPQVSTTAPLGGVTTPPKQRLSLDEVESPLRNPRIPPKPPVQLPAIEFIPATPSGITTAVASRPPPARRPSLVQRAFGRRRHSIDYPPNASRTPGFFTRTFSLSRSSSRSSDTRRSKPTSSDMDPSYGDDDYPVEDDKLHPSWRPVGHLDDRECDRECCQGNVYRYPPIDNRPRIKRSLSDKIKRTFTVLPTRDDEYEYDRLHQRGPEKRTIRRTPSGSLKVMRRRSSQESLTTAPEQIRPASEGNSHKNFWRGRSVQRHPDQERVRTLSRRRFEGLPDLTRRWSERRREKRTQELRQKISAPRQVRDGVGEVIRLTDTKDTNGYPQRI